MAILFCSRKGIFYFPQKKNDFSFVYFGVLIVSKQKIVENLEEHIYTEHIQCVYKSWLVINTRKFN